MWRKKYLTIWIALLFGCSDQASIGPPADASIQGNVDFSYHAAPGEPDSDPCEEATTTDPIFWCYCNPLCCQTQLWFCAPEFGNPALLKKEVVVDICNDLNEPCSYGSDELCPPPEILVDGECIEAFECPPSAQGLDYGWQWCEMEDGSVGKQHVTCDKGQLYYTPCQPCSPEVCDLVDNDCDSQIDEDIGIGECNTDCGQGVSVCVEGEEVCFGDNPSEEICDGIDNDCDGQTDENQTNICGECGPVPAEVCNNFDDDCDGDIDEDLIQQCNTACGVGVEICAEGFWVGCTADQPQQEICDGFDNDCNGQIDDGIECLCTVQELGVLFPCSEDPLLCGQGFKTCECLDLGCLEISVTSCFSACHWVADPPGSDENCNSFIGMALQAEECNNFDDNCNQLIDEDLTTPCYSGPPGTVGVGICAPGVMTCDTGKWGSYLNDNDLNFIPGLCSDEVVPSEEVCNGEDDDCDGQIDWGEEMPETDILFIIDWSGSMGEEIQAVLIALNQFAANYADQGALQWGLIVGPKAINPGSQHLVMVSDISPFANFLAQFAGLGSEGMGTQSEMLLDALYLSMQNIAVLVPFVDLDQIHWIGNVNESIPPKEQFNLSWRPEADRIIIVFTDEEEQSFLSSEILPADIIDLCQATPRLKLYTFSTDLSWNWDEMSDQCAGQYYPLEDDPFVMYNQLMDILDEICMP